MPTGTPLAPLAPDPAQSGRIPQLLERLGRSLAAARTAATSEIVAAPSFVGNLADLARAARAAADEAAAAASRYEAARRPAPEPVVARAALRQTIASAPPPAAAEPPAPAECDLQPPPETAPPAAPSAVAAVEPQSEPAPNTDECAPFPIGGYQFALLNAEDEKLVQLDPATGQLTLRSTLPPGHGAVTVCVAVRDARGDERIEPIAFAAAAFAAATDNIAIAPAIGAAAIEAQPQAIAPPPIAADAEAADCLVIDDLGPVEADISSYLAVGPNGVVNLIRVAEEVEPEETDIVIIDGLPDALIAAAAWRSAMNRLLDHAGAQAMWTAPPTQAAIGSAFIDQRRTTVRAPSARLPMLDLNGLTFASQLKMHKPGPVAAAAEAMAAPEAAAPASAPDNAADELDLSNINLDDLAWLDEAAPAYAVDWAQALNGGETQSPR